MQSFIATALLLAQANSDAWTEQLFSLDQNQRFVLLLTAIGCMTAIIISLVTIISRVFDSMHRRRAEADLKREMLERGMSAEEIARVIEAAQPTSYLDRWAAAQAKGKKS